MTKESMMKKSLVFLFCLIFLLQLVIAQDYRMEISMIPEDKIFEPGETIQLKVNLYDANNNLVSDQVSVTFKDLKENIIQTTTIQSNGNFEEIELDANAMAGKGQIIVKYHDSEVNELFFVSEKKLAEFKVEEEKLIITNIGNTKYDKGIYITIGDTIGTKSPLIDVGKSIYYRLIAPEGVYNLKVREKNEDGSTSLVLEIREVRLTGTGKVIGVLDEQGPSASGITGISPNENSEGELLNYIKRSKFVYVFVAMIFGAMILLAIERRYKRKINK